MIIDTSQLRQTAQRERRPWHGAAFVVEALVLLAFLVTALAVVMQVMSASYERGAQADELSDAIVIASNDAEAFAADPTSTSFDTHFANIDGALVPTSSASESAGVDANAGANAGVSEDANADVNADVSADVSESANAGANAGASASTSAGATASADASADADTGAAASANTNATYELSRTVDAQATEGGTLYRAHITVSCDNSVIYELDTARYLSDKGVTR